MPTPSIRTLHLTQIGKETTKGTAVAATEILLADAELRPNYELYRNEHPFGVMVEHAGPTALLKEAVDVGLKMNGASYEQLPWFLSLCLDQPATSGTGPYVHTWAPGSSGLWNPHSATLEGRWTNGTNNEDVEVEYVTGRTLRLRGEQRGALEAEVDAFGRQVTDAAVTSLSAPSTLTPITMATARLYMNDSWANADVGPPSAGLYSTQFLSFDLEVDCGQYPADTIENIGYFAAALEKTKNFRLNLRCYYNPDSASEGGASERAHAAAEDMRFPTLYFAGPGNMEMRIVLAGTHEKPEFLPSGEQDGQDLVEMSIVGHYDGTGAELVKVVLSNDDADPL